MKMTKRMEEFKESLKRGFEDQGADVKDIYETLKECFLENKFMIDDCEYHKISCEQWMKVMSELFYEAKIEYEIYSQRSQA